MSEMSELKDRVEGFGVTVGKLGERVGELSTEVARMGALLEAHLNRTKSEIEALFQYTNEHRNRIGEIERTYVSTGNCKEHREAETRRNEMVKADAAAAVVAVKSELGREIGGLRSEQKANTAAIVELKTQMAKVMAIAGLGSVILSAIVNLVAKMVWH